jgi:acylphosphatase
MTVAREVVVHGEVQMVGFRESCRAEAATAGVTGWVRNEPDGTVRGYFEGQPAAVESVVAWVHRGPRHARVESVDVRDVPPEGRSRFEVR